MRILIFGIGGHAVVVAEAIRAEGKHEIVGLISQDGEGAVPLEGLKILGGNDRATEIAREKGAEGAVIALGDAAARRAIVESLGRALKFVTVIHPSAVVSPSADIGEGTVILAGAVVSTRAMVGRHCIINTLASVDHDCDVGDFSHVCPHACLAGHVRLGEGTWVGAGSTIVDRVTVAPRTFLRAGSLVIEPRSAS